jgi:hypothetical protein
VAYNLMFLGVIYQNATVVGTNPVVSITVFANGIDVCQLHTSQTGNALRILVDTILIGTNPHTSAMVYIDLLRGIIRDGGQVELVVQKLTALAGLQIDNKDAVMVCSHPHPATLVALDIPYFEFLRDIVDMAGLEKV